LAVDLDADVLDLWPRRDGVPKVDFNSLSILRSVKVKLPLWAVAVTACSAVNGDLAKGGRVEGVDVRVSPGEAKVFLRVARNVAILHSGR